MGQKIVKIENFKFNGGNDTVIAVGDSVVWQNNDPAPHNAISDNTPNEPVFATKLLSKGDSSDPITFSTPSGSGGFTYHCGPHPFMHGRLIVTLAGTDLAAFDVDLAMAEHHQASSKKP